MCDTILVTLLKMRPLNIQFSREKATPSSGTSPLASYKEIASPPWGIAKLDQSLIKINQIYNK